MGWKFWQKKESPAAQTGEKTRKLDKARELPQDVGRHLVVDQDLDPDWVWGLKCVVRSKDNTDSHYDIRIYSPETAVQRGITVRDYASLENHTDLILFAGWYDKRSHAVQLERLIKEAV